MKKIKRMIAALLCLCMILSVEMPVLHAAEAEELASETDAEILNLSASQTDLNYFVVGSDYIEAGDTQFVLADIGDGTMSIEAAAITYIKKENGASYQVQAGLVSGSSVVFYMDFPNESDTGTYEVTELSYTVSGKEYVIALNEVNIRALFGVNKEVEADPVGWIIEDSQSVSGYSVNEELMSSVTLSGPDGAEITSDDFAMAISEAMENQPMLADDGVLVVCLSPGHAADDPGASYTWNGVTIAERELNLKIAQYCKAELDKYEGIQAYLVRSDNTTDWSIAEMVSYAQSKNADLYVSIHLNSAETTTANGAEVWIPHGNTSYQAEAQQKAAELAQNILDRLVSLGLNDRGLKIRYSESGKDPYPDGAVADYLGEIYRCRLAGLPGIIVEHAFINNEYDATRFLMTEEGLKSLGVADAQGILKYFNEHPETVDRKKIEQFVTRLYRTCLNREPDEEGMDTWSSLLITKKGTGTSVAKGFVYSPEYTAKNVSNEEYVDMLYHVFLDRESDEAGKNTWLDLLNQGMSRDYVFRGFAQSTEYTNICNDYGIERGTVTLTQPRDMNVNMTKYVNRLYTYVLDRNGETDGLNDWCRALQNKLYTPIQVADYFVLSKEFKAKNLSDEEYIKVLYRAFLGREYDEAGLNTWLNELRSGKSRETVLQGFTGSIEFRGIMADFGFYVYEGTIPIMGKTDTTVSQMAAYYRANATYPAYYQNSDAPTIEDFCRIYIEECEAEGVRAEVAFTQAMKETGFLRYGGAVKIEQYNFAGIGATDSGGTPATFETVRLGVRAQVQHLKAYASRDSLNNACVDPRFSLVTRGVATYVEWLGIQENPYGKGWASAKNYGHSIIYDYMVKLKKY
ncbi:MAG: DUF4214 domain-containing protein [Clostridium sp.]|nr:DUF4214 domain-containing protein [Clostridium sp.]